MKYKDITQTEDITQSILILKGGKKLDQIDSYKQQFEIADNRDILNKAKRPDKQIKKKIENDEEVVARVEEVTRIPIALQKRIVNSTVSFTFGNPVELVCEDDSENGQKILSAVKRMLSDNKIDSFNRRIARDLARCTEVAECWFPVAAENDNRYGFSTPFKIRVQQFSPWNGDDLYPQYDKTGDMIGFGRGFEVQEVQNKIEYFELYTDEEKIVWKKEGSDWIQDGDIEPNVLKKIPVIYAKQDEVEWHDVEKMINRLEKLLSNFGDTNDYFGSPILTIAGDLRNAPDKDTQGKAFQLENGAKAEFLSWDQAPEAIKLEIETLLRFIYSLTQTPDISFDSVKGLREISGEALKMLFLDAHLKVQDKREILDEYLQRRLNVLKAFVGVLNTGLKSDVNKIEILPKIVPFTITSEKDLIDRLSEANGGKALISQKTAVALSGLVDDVDAEYEQIQEEQKREKQQNVLETATIL